MILLSELIKIWLDIIQCSPPIRTYTNVICCSKVKLNFCGSWMILVSQSTISAVIPCIVNDLTSTNIDIYYMLNITLKAYRSIPGHMTFSNYVYWLKIPYLSVHIFSYWLLSWYYYCDVRLHYSLTRISLVLPWYLMSQWYNMTSPGCRTGNVSNILRRMWQYNIHRPMGLSHKHQANINLWCLNNIGFMNLCEQFWSQLFLSQYFCFRSLKLHVDLIMCPYFYVIVVETHQQVLILSVKVLQNWTIHCFKLHNQQIVYKINSGNFPLEYA